jgi:hypothetical protein
MAAGDPINYSDVATRIATTPIVANSATWTTSESGALYTVTASLVNGWNYKITAMLFVSSTVAADAGFMRLREDNATGTQDVGANVSMPTTSGNGWQVFLDADYSATATGSKIWVITGSRLSGSGTQGCVHSTSRPGYLRVDRVVS